MVRVIDGRILSRLRRGWSQGVLHDIRRAPTRPALGAPPPSDRSLRLPRSGVLLGGSRVDLFVAMNTSAAKVIPIRETRVITDADEQALAAIAAHLHAGGIVVLVPPASDNRTA